MKQSPELDTVQARMQAGRISRDGFLGRDRRALAEILAEDENTVNRLGLTHEQIAHRMEYFMEQGMRGLGTSVIVDGRFDVRVRSVRGSLPCPWGGKGLYPKTNVFLKNLDTGDELMWTALTVHLIRRHGFYEGKGSTFRVDPEKAKSVLEL